MRKCISCGAELDDNAMFCAECGTKQEKKQFCSSCGAEIKQGAKFCSSCGAKLSIEKIVCINCGAELKPGMKFCVECGTPTQEGCSGAETKTQVVRDQQMQDSQSLDEELWEEELTVDEICNYEADYDDDEEAYGYKDENDNWVIKPQFEEAEDFEGGFGLVEVDGKMGFVKSDGTYLVEPKFSNADSFSFGLARVKLNGKWGYIKSNGEFLIEPKFDHADSFVEGMASFKIGDKCGYINTNGNVVIEPIFDEAFMFSEGLAAVMIDDKLGYITPTGSYFVKPIFDVALYFEDGKAHVQIGENIMTSAKGELYRDGKLILDGKEMSVFDLYSDVVKSKKGNNGLYGFVDADGDWIVKPEFDKVWDFGADDIALVQKDGKFGFINKEGSVIIEPSLEDANSFSEGFAKFKQDGKYGFIKTDGSLLAPPIFEDASYFDSGRVSIELDGDPGYLYSDGVLLIGNKKINIDRLMEKKSAIDTKDQSSQKKEKKLIPFEDEEDGMWGYKDQDGDIVVMAMLDSAEEFDGDYARVIIGGNEMYIDKSGNLCEDKNGTLFVPQEDEEPDLDESSYDSAAMPKKKSLVGKMAKKAWEGFKNSTGSSSSEPKKTVRKVWRCTYTGSHNAAPKVLDVPSENASGRPTGSEFVAALKNMGFDDGMAHSIANGGSSACWRCE